MLFYYKIISKYIFFILANINMYVIVFYIQQQKLIQEIKVWTIKKSLPYSRLCATKTV